MTASKKAPSCTCGGDICGKPVKRFKCEDCGRMVPWCYGAADDQENKCDDCAVSGPRHYWRVECLQPGLLGGWKHLRRRRGGIMQQMSYDNKKDAVLEAQRTFKIGDGNGDEVDGVRVVHFTYDEDDGHKDLETIYEKHV